MNPFMQKYNIYIYIIKTIYLVKKLYKKEVVFSSTLTSRHHEHISYKSYKITYACLNITNPPVWA